MSQRARAICSVRSSSWHWQSRCHRLDGVGPQAGNSPLCVCASGGSLGLFQNFAFVSRCLLQSAWMGSSSSPEWPVRPDTSESNGSDSRLPWVGTLKRRVLAGHAYVCPPLPRLSRRTPRKILLFCDALERFARRLDPIKQITAFRWEQPHDLVSSGRGRHTQSVGAVVDQLSDLELMMRHCTS